METNFCIAFLSPTLTTSLGGLMVSSKRKRIQGGASGL